MAVEKNDAALRKALAAVSGLDAASAEVGMMVAVCNGVLCQSEFILAARRGYGGFEVTWSGLGTGSSKARVKWHQMSMFEVLQ